MLPKFRKSALALVLLSMSLSFFSCTDEEVSDTIGAVAEGVIIGAVIAAGPVCHGGYRETCANYINPFGENIRECRQVYDSCAETYSAQDSAIAAAIGAPAPAATLSPTSEAIALKYNMSFESADKLSAALNQARAHDTSGLRALGLSNNDFSAIANGQEITMEGTRNLSASLNLSERAVMQSIALIEKDAK